jgi:hypothetical protein
MNRKISFLCFFFAVANLAYSQDNFYRAVYNGDINYIRRYYINSDYPNEHFNFSNSDLRILRNTIYAMHGYIFRSRDLQEHFQKFAWYSGTKTNVENELSENELRIIRIIVATETANPPVLNNLIGRWQWPAPPGSDAISLGFQNLYLYADGTMRMEEQGYEGFWSLEGTTFRIRYYDRYLQREIIEEEDNFRINFIEYNGELYQEAEFPNGRRYYGPNRRPPAQYWRYEEQK